MYKNQLSFSLTSQFLSCMYIVHTNVHKLLYCILNIIHNFVYNMMLNSKKIPEIVVLYQEYFIKSKNMYKMFANVTVLL